jgi:DNA-binding NtrC family response regulator
MLNRPAYTQLGQSGAIEQVLTEARLVSATNFNVMLAGAPGVGKGLLAQCIHENSPRRQRKMLSRNCAGVAQSRMETELFGHGGLLERAHRSTLLLDDVGELGPRTQGLLYRFLDTGEVRIISATNRDLLQADSKQAFCADLYYRLNLAYLQIPALRERREDISFLMEHNLKIFSEQFRLKLCKLAPSAMSTLEAYSWPGNIRELREVAKLLALTQAGRVVAVDQLPETVLADRGPMPAIETAAISSSVADAVATACYDQITQSGESFWTVVYGPFLARKLTRDTVRAVVSRGLRQTNGSYKVLATLFNLRPTDHRRFLTFLEEHNCHPRPVALRAGTEDGVRVARASHRRAV